MNENTKEKIIQYINTNANDFGYYGSEGFKILGTLEYHSEFLNYNDCETAEDVIEIITQSIYESAQVIYTYNAYQFIWECGLSEAQAIADEFGIDKPLDEIEGVATILLQQRLVDEINCMRDAIDDIITCEE